VPCFLRLWNGRQEFLRLISALFHWQPKRPSASLLPFACRCSRYACRCWLISRWTGREASTCVVPEQPQVPPAWTRLNENPDTGNRRSAIWRTDAVLRELSGAPGLAMGSRGDAFARLRAPSSAADFSQARKRLGRLNTGSKASRRPPSRPPLPHADACALWNVRPEALPEISRAFLDARSTPTLACPGR